MTTEKLVAPAQEFAEIGKTRKTNFLQKTKAFAKSMFGIGKAAKQAGESIKAAAKAIKSIHGVDVNRVSPLYLRSYSGQGEFHPRSHTVQTYRGQARAAKKRRNIAKHSKH